VPIPHFGLAMSVPEFHALAERVRAAGVKFIIEPHIRFVGQPGEQVRIQFFSVRWSSAGRPNSSDQPIISGFKSYLNSWTMLMCSGPCSSKTAVATR
jgi:hypothetical protein